MIEFPPDFVWGASTSAYQIEGAVREDGRGASIWDTFSHTPGRIAGGDTGDVAADHYHRYREDVRLMADLGLDAYRFSVAWPRVFPTGSGRLNRPGLDFYERLVDELLAAGITPWPCLYHWDLPQALQDRGGWTNRDTAYWFADYAQAVGEALADRVPTFLLLNEPNVVALLGHLLGVHAPGKADISAYAAATHHLNLATGLGAQRLRDVEVGRLGTILNLEPVEPAGEAEEDLAAARMFDAFRNRNYADPLLLGSYPEATAAMFEPYLQDGDEVLLQPQLDLLGLNLYSRVRVKADPASLVGLRQLEPPRGSVLTSTGWEVYPRALYDQLLLLKERYGNPPVYVTENGAAFDDRPGPDGRVSDRARIRFLARYLRAVSRAIEEGADVRGYFVWSLLDNFEWAEGYAKRFGLVHVDYESQRRTPKDSFGWYAAVVRDNGFTMPADVPESLH